jgi:hypothetical protein
MINSMASSVVRRRRHASDFNPGFVTFVGIGCQLD